jgi:hypothetical protein
VARLRGDLHGGEEKRGEAAAGTKKDTAAWRSIPNRGNGDFGPKLS